MGNTNRKKTVASRGVVNKKAPLKDAEPVYRPRSFVVWQKDVQVELDKKDAFVQHLVENYYSTSETFSHRKRTLSDWLYNKILSQSHNEGTGYISVDVPLLVSEHKSEGWEECEIARRGKCYYLPLPPLDIANRKDAYSIDNVFQKGDTIIGSLVFPDEVDSVKEQESICEFTRADLDAARDREKQAYSKLLDDIAEYKTKQRDDSCVYNLQNRCTQLEEDKRVVEDKLLLANQKLDNAEADKRKAVLECESKYIQEHNRLKAAVQLAESTANDYKSKWAGEESKRKKAEQIILDRDQTIAERDSTIRRKDMEMKEYASRAVFFLSAQVFCQRVMTFFDLLDKLLNEASLLKVNVPSAVNADDYNYYLARIEKKFYSTKVNQLYDWKREMQMLSSTGMVPANGLINTKLGIDRSTGKYKVNESQWESTLRMLLYQSIMVDLAGAAVTMSDELAYMLPQMVPGVGEKKVFIEISEMLQKAIKDIGYELNYVKPFTQLSQYKDVENVQFTEADVPSGTIFEVLKMALNYGSTKKKTEVSAKQ